MTKFTLIFVAAGLLLSAADRGSAATISAQNPMGPFFSDPGDPYRAEQVQPDLVRVLGNGFTQGSVGTTAMRTLSFTGSFTGDPTDLFSAIYRISVRLDQFSTGGSFQFNLFITPAGSSESQIVNDGGPLTPTSDPNAFQVFTGDATVPTGASSGTFRGELIISMTGLPARSFGGSDGTPPPTATLQINEIDLQVAPIPEPSTYALLAVGLLGLVYKMRRRVAA